MATRTMYHGGLIPEIYSRPDYRYAHNEYKAKRHLLIRCLFVSALRIQFIFSYFPQCRETLCLSRINFPFSGKRRIEPAACKLDFINSLHRSQTNTNNSRRARSGLAQ